MTHDEQYDFKWAWNEMWDTIGIMLPFVFLVLVLFIVMSLVKALPALKRFVANRLKARRED